jgi:hypothetical protein
MKQFVVYIYLINFNYIKIEIFYLTRAASDSIFAPEKDFQTIYTLIL